MSIASELKATLGPKSRRDFLKAMSASGMLWMGRSSWGAMLPKDAHAAASKLGKKITLLEDGGFQNTAWGWQLTGGARLSERSRRQGFGSIEIDTASGDYARFLVIGPEIGKTYTLSGWVCVERVKEQEEAAGAYFTASQFEFQGRPTEYTVDGKQLPEKRFGNYTGTGEWRHFSESFLCLAGTTWFEVVAGIFRASGKAWFTELTFVEGKEAAAIDDVFSVDQALEATHKHQLQQTARKRPAAAILRDAALPVRGAGSDPEHLASILREAFDVEFLSASQLADPARLNRGNFDLLVLAYGESFPLPAREAVQRFLADGGDLLSTGGYAFQSPLIQKGSGWKFYEEEAQKTHSENLLPSFADGWLALETQFTSTVMDKPAGAGREQVGRVKVPENVWNQISGWYVDAPASGEGNRYRIEGWIRLSGVRPAPHGGVTVGVEQLDEKGIHITAALLDGDLKIANEGWQRVEKTIFLTPGCAKLRIGFGLQNATGTVEGGAFRLESIPPQVRINTSMGFPQDDLQIGPRQIGMFDADFRLKRVAGIRAAAGQHVIADAASMKGSFEGYAATCVVGMNHARWIPLLESYDALGRLRGAAGALTHHVCGPYARGSWAFFGVENKDLFAAGSMLGTATLRSVTRTLATKCYLHECEADLACYERGESVRLRTKATNYGRSAAHIEVRLRIEAVGGTVVLFRKAQTVSLEPGQTAIVAGEWKPGEFAAERYRITAELVESEHVFDSLESGFLAWHDETLAKGLNFEFKDNYFQVGGKSLFLQGTDDYLHTFIDRDENPLTWSEDAQGCRDTCIDVYENLMGMRGPQHRPTKTWWRWIDAMLLNVQRAGGAFFPGMLVFSNTAVSNADLADQQAYVEAFARRYGRANGIMYYLNGDLELHDPNLPDLQKLYNQFLRSRYGSDEKLRQVWTLSPPKAKIGEMTIETGKDDWRDVRTRDDFEFRAMVVRRWLNAMHDAIRKADTRHPVTAEFYSLPLAGIDLLNTLDKLELANFGYFFQAEDDFYRFPQSCKFLDQRVRGKGLNVGEFGVKTHPAWVDAEDYFGTRSEPYEQALFLAIAHYGFALGASKIQNWCWKYPSDLPFEWGINYPNQLIGRDVRAFYRNSGMFFRRLRPRYQPSDVVLLIAGDNRKGGQGARVLDAIYNSVRLLIDERVEFNSLADDYIDKLPAGVKTIFYPLPYSPSDEIVARLRGFVEAGGQLYISGDITYSLDRRRTRLERLEQLCGVRFVAERYEHINYELGAQPVVGKAEGWPSYVAAPGIEIELAGAHTLVESHDGKPVVTEFALGKGKVIFSADPVEMHGDPRDHAYAHQFYHALCGNFGLRAEKVTPEQAPVHCFRVPSQDDRQMHIVVNTSAKDAVKDLRVATDAGEVRLTLDAHMSGAVVVRAGKAVEAVESSSDVTVDDRKLIGTDLHVMAVAPSGESLDEARMLVFLPMGQGTLRIPKAKRWTKPVVLVGEVLSERWRQYERFTPGAENGELKIELNEGRALGVLILCEAGAAEAAAVKHVEQWVSRPCEQVHA